VAPLVRRLNVEGLEPTSTGGLDTDRTDESADKTLDCECGNVTLKEEANYKSFRHLYNVPTKKLQLTN